ncbi:hypothetical protein ACHAXT_002482 [Thalassiosira profunda]
MTWNCAACTYSNVNDGATRCFACGTGRPAPAIVDLTGGCSPKPQGGSMQSNRSRRRRRQEGTAMGEEAASSSHPPTAPSNGNNNGSLSRSAANANGAREKRKNDAATSNQCVIDVDSFGSNDMKESKGGTGAASGRRKGGDEDTIVDPTPRRKVPLNTNDRDKHEGKSSSGRRKESKLKTKKRRLEHAGESAASHDNPDPTRRSKENKGNIYGEQSTSNAESRRSDSKDGSKERGMTSQNRDHSRGKAATSYDNSDHRWRSSKESGPERAIQSAPARKSDDQSSIRKTGGRLTDFYNKPTQPQASAEELMGRANAILRQTFKHQSLRPLQEAAVKNALQRSSQIVIMATGGGKSLTYQLPALAGGNNIANVRADNSSVTIVVCPLIALMVDQVNNLCRKGVRTAACLSSSLSQKAKQEIYSRLSTDKSEAKGRITSNTHANVTPIQLLYCTPELIETERFRAVLQRLYRSNRLYMIAIDEAHCLSTWGHDFRPAYRKLTWVREEFPDVPVTACTGTATPKVIKDIRDVLQLDKSVPCLMGTFNRPNLTYEVRFKDSLNTTSQGGALADLVSVVKKEHGAANKENQPCSGIVYVHKKDDCQSLAAQIAKATGLVCLAYHGGLKDSQREETQRKWTEGSCQIAVATIAFGMGIDLPHVRYVIHWHLAKTLEGFYQESGRGGRDGKPSLSILYYSKDDASKFEYLFRMNAEREAKKKGKRTTQMADHQLVELEQMVNYCTTPTCRRTFVLKHFGEKTTGSLCGKTCDFCIDPKRVQRDTQASECMSSVLNSHRMHAGRKRQDEEKKYHHNPLEDEDSLEDGSDDFFCTGDGLGISGCLREDEKPSASLPKSGFVKASSVLSKYDTLETKGQKKGAKGSGFVNFKTRFAEPSDDEPDTKRQRAVNIPQHLREGMPDPLAAYNKPKPAAKSSKAYASESERLKAELAELQKQKAAALAKMNLSSRGTSKMLPPPTLSFKKRR